MEALESYKSAIKEQIEKDLANPIAFKQISPYLRSQRSGITSRTYQYLQLYKMITGEPNSKSQVELAYKLILGRPADLGGLLAHQKTLKYKGVKGLIMELRYSAEGRKKSNTISGLFIPYCKYKLKSWLSRTN
ncbi:MAG: hypothetical protein HRU09_03540 [Oligoflexales bacterium]|nr:hypothetical protein [Oligoflexales bacterium]